MHRTLMVKLLESALPPADMCTIHTSRRLVAYDDRDGTGAIVLTFADGTMDETDLLIGADGVRSAVRRGMFEDGSEFANARWTGTLAYRFLAQADDVRAKASTNGYESNVLKGAVFVSKAEFLAWAADNRNDSVLWQIQTCCFISDNTARL